MQEDEPYIITKRRTVRRIHWGRIAAAVFLLSAVVMGCVFWFSRTPRALHTRARTYRLVTVGEYADLGEASARADDAIRAGGAGYLYGQNSYAVALACYASKEDAETVCARLQESGEDASVTAITCNAITLDKPSQNADELKRMLSMPARLFDELYTVSVQTDGKEISEAAAKYAALKMRVACVEYAGVCGNFRSDAGAYLAALFLSLADTLDAPANASENVAPALKYALCETAVKICAHTSDFCDKIKNCK